MQLLTRGDKARTATNAGRGYLSLLFASFLLFAVPAHALLVDLDAYVEFPILGNDGMTPLADGSWVVIIGSGDAVQDPMFSLGTNFVALSVTGDDVILGAIQLPLNVGTNSGEFFTTVQYESDTINYTYIRFFDTPGPLTGQLYWGTSDMYQLGVTLGVSTVQYDPGTNLVATNNNNFIIIPEPSTANLFVVVAGMLWAMRVHRRVAERRKDEDDPGDDEPPPPGPGSDKSGHNEPLGEKPVYGLDFGNIYRQRAGPPDSAPVTMRVGWTHHPPPPS